MELCDNCGKFFNIAFQGGGDVDDGYYCNEKCQNELFNENYFKEE